MEMNVALLSDKEIESTSSEVNMKLSKNAQSMVFQLFTKNVYSNPIGTIVREITSNCFDSHVEANVNLPVIIRKTVDNETNNTYISFIDYGVGMSRDRVKNIYGVYFESTKRVTNTQIGGYGIGGKSPLAYKRFNGEGENEYDNSFSVITIFNKIKYTYVIYEGANTPVISLLHKEKTKEGNGTEVRIPILSKDVSKFVNEMVKQLYYFENIIFEGFDNYANIKNDYQIIRGNTFLYRGLSYSENVHICLGRVAYPIDYGVLGLSSYDFKMPVALKLNVGDINVTVSRESVDYSEKTIKFLKSKLIEVKQEISDMLIKQYENITTLSDYFEVKNEFGRLYFPNGSSMYVGNIIKHENVSFSNFAYKLFKMPTDKQLFNLFFEVRQYGKKTKSRYNSNKFVGGYSEIVNNPPNVLHIDSDTFNRKVIKQAYLNQKHTTYYIISPRDLYNDNVAVDICELFHVPLNSIISQGEVNNIEQYLNMQKEFFELVKEHTVNYDDLIVPDDFIQSRKRKNVIDENVLNNDINVVFYAPTLSSRDKVKLKEFVNYKMPIFYCTQDDENLMSDYAHIYSCLFDKGSMVSYYTTYKRYGSKQPIGFNRNNDGMTKSSIMFIMVSKSNLKYIKLCGTAKHISTFTHEMLYRKESAVVNFFKREKINTMYNKIDSFFKDSSLPIIDYDLSLKMSEIKNRYVALNTNVQNVSTDIYSYGIIIKRIFNIDNIKYNKDDIKLMNDIEEIIELQKKNEDMFRYINMPRELCNANNFVLQLIRMTIQLQ